MALTNDEITSIVQGVSKHLEHTFGKDVGNIAITVATLKEQLAAHLVRCDERHITLNNLVGEHDRTLTDLTFYKAEQGDVRQDVNKLLITNARVLGALLGIGLVGGAGGGLIVKVLGG